MESAGNTYVQCNWPVNLIGLEIFAHRINYSPHLFCHMFANFLYIHFWLCFGDTGTSL